MLDDVKQIEKSVLEAYREELRKHRREAQVEKMLEKEKNLEKGIQKCALNLIKWNLQYDVRRYVACQFFALNYMPYLPKMMHVASDKGKQRFEKYKDFFEKLISKRKKKTFQKKMHRKVEVNRELLKVIVGVQGYEEKDKARFHNTIKGLLFCLENTTLFHPDSKHCVSCKFRKICMKKLKSAYPLMYKFRTGRINKSTLLKKLQKHEMEILL